MIGGREREKVKVKEQESFLLSQRVFLCLQTGTAKELLELQTCTHASTWFHITAIEHR